MYAIRSYYVEEQQADAGSIDQGKERVVQNFGDKVRDCFYFSLFNKMEICQVNQNENEDGDTGVRHGFGADGPASC